MAAPFYFKFLKVWYNLFYMKYIFAVLFFASYSFVNAQESTISIPQKRVEIQQKIDEKKLILESQIQQKRLEIKEKIDALTPEQKPQFQIFAQEKTLKVISQIFERFEAVLVKFDGIILRTEAKITVLEEAGQDTLIAKELLETAKQDLASSTVLIAASKLELQDSVSKGITKDQIKIIVDLCKESLKNTQQTLMLVVENLKIEQEI